MKLPLSLLVLLAACWWLLSGHATGLLLGLGAASVLFTLWLSMRMDVIDRESHPVHMSLRLVHFWALLLRDIVISNLQVMRLILSPRTALSPEVVRVPMRHTSDLAQVVLANAITLTPGTVTMEIEDGRLVVHALTRATADDIRAGTMERRVPSDVEDEA
jgi:multicomponent Na+:H+ antiporter subunit E